MTPRIMDRPPAPGTPDWTRQITASKVAAILGISRFKSPYALWHEMAGNVTTEPLEGDHLDWGHDAEASLALWWRRHHPGWQLNKGGEIAYTNTSLPFPNQVTLDRRARRGRRFHIVECKTARDIDTWGRPGDQDSIPADYYAQVTFQMGVSGIHEASLVVLGYGTPEIHPVTFDEALFEGIVDRCQQWWESLEKGAPPPLDDHPATYETVRGLHPEIDRGSSVEIPADVAQELLAAVLAGDEGEKAVVAAKTRAARLMGDARLLTCGGVKIADRRSKQGGKPYVQFEKKAKLP